MSPRLMSYNQIDFQSKFHLEAELNRMEELVKQTKEKFKEAGLLSFTVTQIWNKQATIGLVVIFHIEMRKPLLHVKKS